MARVKGQRPDIQGLRTVAVGIVILYHVWPNAVPGGFVGVDVFFVISGYLIVGSLVREAIRSGSIGIVNFYARRIRRLVPAATSVLLATMLATVLILPQGRWQGIARDVVAAALQVQNWNQAFSSASYEGATAMVSPVQHYWSLAVEEQFYLVIPLLLLGAVGMARLWKSGTERACIILLSLVTFASFVHSVFFSATSHDIAYFATTTRMWELGVGGLAALFVHKFSLKLRLVGSLGWVGLGMILFATEAYSTDMQFPGSVAAIPVFGAVLILVSGANRKQENAAWFVTSLLSRRSLVFIGDISYSLYLWHWPLVVFYIFELGRAPGIFHGSLIILLSLALATLSNRYIEEPFRHGKPLRTPQGRRFSQNQVRARGAYAVGAALLVSSCVVAVVPWAVVQQKVQSVSAIKASVNYPGALAFAPDRPAFVPKGIPVAPDPAVATADQPITASSGCNLYDPMTVPDNACWFGKTSGGPVLVVVGDSHAAQYVDPIIEIANSMGGRVRAMVRNGCPFSSVPASSHGVPFAGCAEQNKLTLQKIVALHPDAVVVAGMTPYGYEKSLNWTWSNPAALVTGYEAMIKPMVDAGIKVRLILDSPYPSESIPDCVSQNIANVDKCAFPNNEPFDPLRQVAKDIPGAQAIALTPYFCQSNSCPAVIGNVLVYRDNHMTNTFAKTLTGPLQTLLGL